MNNLESGAFVVNLGVFIATAGAAAVAWWQAIEASRARNDARDAEKAALHAWQEASAALLRANDISGFAQRAPYAHALHGLALALLAGRWLNSSTDDLAKVVNERTPGIAEKRFAAGDVPLDGITRWAAQYARGVDLHDNGEPSLDAYFAANRRVDEVIRLWLRDPDAGDALARQDPLVSMED